MKTTIRIFALVAMLAAVTVTGLAGDNDKLPYDKDQAERNLLVGLASDNLGLRESCASCSARSVRRKPSFPHGDVA